MDAKIQEFELKILHYIRNNLSTPFLDFLFQALTFLGEKYILLLVTFIVYYIIDKDLGKKLIYAICTCLVYSTGLKGIIKYPRPFNVDSTLKSIRTETATGYSFPSGHTQNAVATYFTLAIGNNFSKKVKKIIWMISVSLIVLISYSRIYLGVHYPKDVLFGIIFGMIISYLSNILLNKFKDSYIKQVILYSITLIITIPLLFIFYKNKYEHILIYRDFYISFALFLGCIIGFIIDLHLFNYTTNTTIKKKVLRVLVASIIALAFMLGLKYLFILIVPQGNIFLDMIRYFFVSFGVLVFAPLLFKKLFTD